jgi:hypothetical protein
VNVIRSINDWYWRQILVLIRLPVAREICEFDDGDELEDDDSFTEQVGVTIRPKKAALFGMKDVESQSEFLDAKEGEDSH